MFNLIAAIINGAMGFFNKRTEADLEKYKIDGKVDIAEVQARAEVAKERAVDSVDRWGRRLLIYPTGVWFALIAYTSSFMENSYIKPYVWIVHDLPKNVEYIPYAVVGYLLISVARR